MVCGLVLAAGASRRMGSVDKLLLPVEGAPMIRRVVRIALAAGLAPVVVVTPSPAGSVGRALEGLAVRLVENENAKQGLSSSLRRGLDEVPDQARGVVVLLGDMPWVSPNTVGALVSAFDQVGGQSPCVPVRGGRWGNPVLWPAAFVPEMRTLEGDRGARPLLDLHADRVCEVPVDDEGIHRDLDTPADMVTLPPGRCPPTA
jgi:molybdenum cofactor cytidylyltransferase